MAAATVNRRLKWRLKWQRVATHLLLAAFSGLALWLTLLKPQPPNSAYALAFGYAALALIAVSLLIGPFKLLWLRRTPVNLDLRRDVGIWAGIAGCLHVFFGLQVHMGGDIILYFVTPRWDGHKPLLNLFGLSNYVGLVATVVLVGLLLISNNLSLRWLKGPHWKFWQRFNYLLWPLTLLHTWGYQLQGDPNGDKGWLVPFVLAVALLTLAGQASGYWLYRSKRRRRKLDKASTNVL